MFLGTKYLSLRPGGTGYGHRNALTRAWVIVEALAW